MGGSYWPKIVGRKFLKGRRHIWAKCIFWPQFLLAPGPRINSVQHELPKFNLIWNSLLLTLLKCLHCLKQSLQCSTLLSLLPPLILLIPVTGVSNGVALAEGGPDLILQGQWFLQTAPSVKKYWKKLCPLKLFYCLCTISKILPLFQSSHMCRAQR